MADVEAAQERSPGKPRCGPIAAWIDLGGWPVLLLSVAGFFGAWDWRLDLTASFRFQYAWWLGLIALDASARGHGLRPTWPDRDVMPYGVNALTMIPIDPILHDRSIATVDRRTLGGVGSDHRFVVAPLRERAAH